MVAGDKHTFMIGHGRYSLTGEGAIQGYLAHNKAPSPRTLHKAYSYRPWAVLGGGRFLMSEVPL